MIAVSQELDSFFVGGRYIEVDDGWRMADQVYVQRRVPRRSGRPYPIVMVHGAGQTAMNFETTPDGRSGWADYFVEEGFSVCLVDQPGRGRSAIVPEAHGRPEPPGTARRVEQRFTASATYGLWPQAHLHTQWPGSGRVGDPIFDQFFASQVSGIADPALREQLMRDAGVALIDRIGPAIVLTHSQAGAFGWLIGDGRPEFVKAIVAIEPGGPPFFDVEMIGPPDYFRDGARSRPYGITITPITYAPPVTDPTVELAIERETVAQGAGLVRGHRQREPARLLAHLAQIPVLVVTGEASYHAGYDHCTVDYLRQAGVTVTHLRLEDQAIQGNGHMMMLENNNLVIAQFISRWLSANGLTSR